MDEPPDEPIKKEELKSDYNKFRVIPKQLLD
jgi:hypothetical protein